MPGAEVYRRPTDRRFPALKLSESKTTTTGVVIATYEPASGDR